MHPLTPSQAHYIKALYELSFGTNEGVRISDIAENLGLSKASVSVGMSKLEKEKLVRKDQHRQVHLTPAGERHAISLLDKCMVIRDFLTEVLKVDQKTAAADACAMEHIVSADTLCALCRYHKSSDHKTACASHCRIPKKR